MQIMDLSVVYFMDAISSKSIFENKLRKYSIKKNPRFFLDIMDNLLI